VTEKVLLEEMTSVEIEEAIGLGKTTVLVVSGASEQHGPHLPTGTDTILGYAIAERAARRLGTALVAPVIRPALSEHHTAFPGSFTLSPETYAAVLEEYCESLAASGFKDLVLMTSHGGNTAVMTAVTPDIAQKLLGRITIHLIAGAADGGAEVHAFFQSQGISRAKAGVHAGYSETSLMLAVKPHLVHMDRAEKGLDDEAFYEPANIPRSQIDSFIHGIDHFSPNGILGDPRGANAEDGEKILEIKVAGLVRAITHAVSGGAA